MSDLARHLAEDQKLPTGLSKNVEVRAKELIRLGCLASDAVSQAEGELHVRSAQRMIAYKQLGFPQALSYMAKPRPAPISADLNAWGPDFQGKKNKLMLKFFTALDFLSDPRGCCAKDS